MSAPLTLRTGWTRLPLPRGPDGTKPRPSRCVGCVTTILGHQPRLLCHFQKDGFLLDGHEFLPCGVSYHLACFRAGPPFTTRRREHQGLQYPLGLSRKTFVCENCTVRAVLHRNLHQETDSTLLALERMRILDMAHSWSRNTHSSYGSKMRVIEAFERQYHVSLFPLTHLPHPRNTPDITLMWCQLP